MEYEIKSDYISDAVKTIGKISGTPKVTVDIGGGSAKKISSELLKKIGCDVNTINDDFEVACSECYNNLYKENK